MSYRAQKHCQRAIEILQNMSFGGGSDDESDSSKQASSSAKGKAAKGSIRQEVASRKRRTLEEAALGRRQPKTSHKKHVTVRTALKHCIKLFGDKDSNDTQVEAARQVIEITQEIFVIYMSISDELQRAKRYRFPEYTPIQHESEIPLIEKGVPVIKGLEGLDKYIRIRAKCIDERDDEDTENEIGRDMISVELQFWNIDETKWSTMDMQFTYYSKANSMELDSLFSILQPPPQVTCAVNNWLRSEARQEGHGVVFVKLAILLQEKCSITTLTLTDSSERRLESWSTLNVSHRLYASVYDRPFLYLDNEFEPYIGDQQGNLRHVAEDQYRDMPEEERDILIGKIEKYKERAANFLERPVTFLFEIPPEPKRNATDEHLHLARKRNKWYDSLWESYHHTFGKDTQRNLLECLSACGIKFDRSEYHEYRKQLEQSRQSVKHKIPTSVFFEIDHEISTLVDMDQWLNLPITLSDVVNYIDSEEGGSMAQKQSNAP